MIVTQRRRFCLTIAEVWYAGQHCTKGDIVYYNNLTEAYGRILRRGKTLHNNLTVTEQELWSQIGKSNRYEINRARREKVGTNFLNAEDLTINVLRDFVSFYFNFLDSKKMQYPCSKTRFLSILNSYFEAEALSISYALYQDRTIVYHLYIIDKDAGIVQLMYSASLFRNDEKESAIMGMANRLLHYEDMLNLRQNGISIYDWGGISDREEIKNISEFKRRFGGTEVDTVFSVEGISLLGRMALLLRRLVKGN